MGNKIDTPHDYNEINLTDIYTSNMNDNYKSSLKKIVEKRLSHFLREEINAEDFFPKNMRQDEEIKLLFEKPKKGKRL